VSVFGAYSRYYNLLYRDKDYAGEVEYVHSLIQRYLPGAVWVLDLGCGTGSHDLLLAAKGYTVTGVDLSEEMLAVAKAQLSSLDRQSPSPVFTLGNVRTVRLDRTFDVVISLFHVMSYQTTNEDLMAAFASARAHLKVDGIFVFDFWYGPAVLTDRPVVRVKRLEDEEIEVVRIAEPAMHYNENCVDVNYQVLVTEKATCRTQRLYERHRMRYLFMPEVAGMLAANRMASIFAAEWMTGREVGKDTWGVCVVGRANG
jgi:SAM-dependent methyltransferase